MAKDEIPDEIKELNEWQEHQYNPGYWINRFSPLFPPKRSQGLAIIMTVELVVLVVAMLAITFVAISTGKSGPLVLVLFISPFALITLLWIYRVKPLKREDQQEKERRNTLQKKERVKKIHRRRKDYK